MRRPAHKCPMRDSLPPSLLAAVRMPRLAPSSRRRLLIVALVVLFVALRLVFLRADPPMSLPVGLTANELFVEPSAKSHEARNFALFGAFQTNPVDNYQFWRLQSPLWVYPLAAWFRAFGVSYASLRVFATMMATLGFVALLALASRKLDRVGVACVGLFAACDFSWILFGRAGLIEPLCIGFATLTLYALVRAYDDLRWIVVAPFVFACAILTKQTAFYLAPLVLGLGVDALVRGRATPRARRRVRIIAIVSSALLVAGLGYYVSRPAYVRTLVWNYGHMLIGADGRQAIQEGRLPSLLKVWQRGTSPSRYYDFYFATLPLTSVLALVELVRIAFRALFRGDRDRWSIAVALWLVSGWGALLWTDELEFRFRLILFPPTMLLAAALLARVAKTRAGVASWPRTAVVIGLVGAFTILHGLPFSEWAKQRRYEILTAGALLRRTIGPKPAVVVGLWAAPLTLETPYACYYVKNDFNATREAISALGVTHALLRDGPDWTASILRRTFGDELAKAPIAAQFRARATTMTLSTFDRPLGRTVVPITPGAHRLIPSAAPSAPRP